MEVDHVVVGDDIATGSLAQLAGQSPLDASHSGSCKDVDDLVIGILDFRHATPRTAEQVRSVTAVSTDAHLQVSRPELHITALAARRSDERHTDHLLSLLLG